MTTHFQDIHTETAGPDVLSGAVAEEVSVIDTRSLVSPVVHSAAGTLGAVVAMIVAYPLDNLRTRLQVLRRESNLGVFSALDDLLKKEGWKGLYAGLKSALVGVGVSWAVYYYFYAFFRAYCQKKMGKNVTKSTVMNLIIAFAAGSLSAVATNPIWVVNTRQKLRQSRHDEDESFFRALANLAKEEGLPGLTSGLSASLVLVANPAIQFAVYEQMRSFLSTRRARAFKTRYTSNGPITDDFASKPALAGIMAGAVAVTPLPEFASQLSTAEVFVLGALSKLVATVATYPYQVIKSRLHARQAHSTGSSSSSPPAYPNSSIGTSQSSNKQQQQSASANAARRLSTAHSLLTTQQPSNRVDGYGGPLDCLVKILDVEGVSGLFRGLESKLLATGLTSAIMFVSYEGLIALASKMARKNDGKLPGARWVLMGKKRTGK
eukprot:GDKJ01048792.1.p1 GENE.GDKJ01048792.1~~GDKJ01048792.1.p1  ORF type:complete len:435 (+),score=68.78 GDKJ01048792.1:23-1327(+)